MEEFMFLGLRMNEGISEEEFYRQFGETVDEVYRPVLGKIPEAGSALENRRENRSDGAGNLCQQYGLWRIFSYKNKCLLSAARCATMVAVQSAEQLPCNRFLM